MGGTNAGLRQRGGLHNPVSHRTLIQVAQCEVWVHQDRKKAPRWKVSSPRFMPDSRSITGAMMRGGSVSPAPPGTGCVAKLHIGTLQMVTTPFSRLPPPPSVPGHGTAPLVFARRRRSTARTTCPTGRSPGRGSSRSSPPARGS